MTRVPSSELVFPGGIRCVPRDVATPAWQAHLLKHPLGVRGVRRSGRAAGWDEEGWGATAPPVLDAAARTTLLGKIASLGDARQRCAVPEVGGRVGKEAEPECYACEEPLVLGCARLLADVGARYAAVADEVLLAVGDAVALPREKLTKRLFASIAQPATWSSLTVLATGKAPREKGWVVRLNRADGVRVELTLGRENLASWKTTYRNPAIPANRAISFLLDAPIPDRTIPLSDVYVVPRGWWERHGS